MSRRQQLLPGIVAPPRKAPRVLMHVIDAGSYNFPRWKCPKCGHDVEIHHRTDPPVSYRRPCPKCPQPWTEPDPYPPGDDNRAVYVNQE